MNIQVLGSGCSNCKTLFERTKEAVKQLDVKVEVEYVTDVSKIIEMGVMSSPVLAIDGKPAFVGFVPDIEKIKKTITVARSPKSSADDCDCGDDACGEECIYKKGKTSCNCGGTC